MEDSEPSMTLLKEIIRLCSMEIKEEENNIQQIILTLLSAWTKNPQNTRILAPSGEGKTYLVTKLARLFPQENIIMLAKATPQSFKYALISKRVVENGSGNWQDYDIAIKPLEEDLAKSKDKEKQQEIKEQIKELRESACSLVDFTNKIIILVDSQSFELFESIKTTLSHDQHEIQSFSVNKSKSGTILGQKFVIRGFPAVIYCSAKDEQKRDETNEINTRFNTVSLNASSKKYREMLKLEAIRSSIPNVMYNEEIISEKQIEQIKTKIRILIEEIKNNDEIFNLYGIGISNLLKDDAGFRTRQFKILNNNIKVHTLANIEHRPKILFSGQIFPISTREDIEEACSLSKEQKEIQSYKIKYFNDYIRSVILEYGNKKPSVNGDILYLTASEISDILSQKDINIDRQRLQETILKPLVEHGFLEKYQDPDNRSRDIYIIADAFLSKQASVESTLIDTSLLDVSCIELFVKKYLEQRFNQKQLEIINEKGDKITPKQLIDTLNEIDAKVIKNRHKMTNNEASKSNEEAK
ncbi:hypothetical protein DSQ20_08540 [Nitrosarchaeum sp. AC2]|nr:hypothetical protein DSQ20_08540 [Nitrosarchaeum sp. AC2]